MPGRDAGPASFTRVSCALPVLQSLLLFGASLMCESHVL